MSHTVIPGGPAARTTLRLAALAVLVLSLPVLALSCGPGQTPAPSATPDPFGDVRASLEDIKTTYADFRTRAEKAVTAQEAAAALDFLTSDLTPKLKDLVTVSRRHPELDAREPDESNQEVLSLLEEIENESLAINAVMADLSQSKWKDDPVVQEAFLGFLGSLGVVNDAELESWDE